MMKRIIIVTHSITALPTVIGLPALVRLYPIRRRSTVNQFNTPGVPVEFYCSGGTSKCLEKSVLLE